MSINKELAKADFIDTLQDYATAYQELAKAFIKHADVLEKGMVELRDNQQRESFTLDEALEDMRLEKVLEMRLRECSVKCARLIMEGALD